MCTAYHRLIPYISIDWWSNRAIAAIRQDLTMIPVPSSCVGFVTGSQGNFLRTWECQSALSRELLDLRKLGKDVWKDKTYVSFIGILWKFYEMFILFVSFWLPKKETTMPAMKHKTLWIHVGWLPPLTLKLAFRYVSQDMRRGMEHLDVLLWLSRPLAASLLLPSDQS